ncbi:hypothetical protein OE88DRAFT_1650413 [Heliocybe sulcata]|uniref:F-box domain-containing protein n=1 Tax=Heliocybe sulcata TaxID=5364 RepID=A0A5C3NL79_9AGAM|nr:hypothetical protein OE88DRAFT_1650413 [Heliocybe sulcata]
MGRKGKSSRAALDKLDQKLDELNSNRNVLLSRLHEVDRNIAHTRSKQAELSAISNSKPPVSILPTEILVEILETCYLVLPDKSKCYFPAYVSLVSRAWRDAVQGTPSLWRTIRASPMRLNRLAHYVERCGSQPLEITFNTRLSYGELRVATALSMLKTKARNWRRIEFRLDSQALMLLMPLLSGLSAPRLKTLCFFPLDDNDTGRSIGLNLNMDVPRLSNVHLCQSPIDWHSNVFCELTTLRIEGCWTGSTPPFTMQNLHRALRDCSSRLRELALELPILSMHAGPVRVDVIELPKLQSLELSYCPSRYKPTDLHAVFYTLSAPALQVLSLAHLVPRAWVTFLRSLLLEPPRYSTVAKLKLDSIPIYGNATGYAEMDNNPEGVGDKFIGAFPALQYLECSGDTDAACILRTLIDHLRVGQCPWPDLGTLAVNRCDLPVLLTFIRMRAEHKRPLNVVRLPQHARELSTAPVDAIEEYVKVEYYEPHAEGPQMYDFLDDVD